MDSNHRLSAYQADALPTELCQDKTWIVDSNPHAGRPGTGGLANRCLTKLGLYPHNKKGLPRQSLSNPTFLYNNISNSLEHHFYPQYPNLPFILLKDIQYLITRQIDQHLLMLERLIRIMFCELNTNAFIFILPFIFLFFKSQQVDSNHRLSAYEAGTLPTELYWERVAGEGFEPPLHGL